MYVVLFHLSVNAAFQWGNKTIVLRQPEISLHYATEDSLRNTGRVSLLLRPLFFFLCRKEEYLLACFCETSFSFSLLALFFMVQAEVHEYVRFQVVC